MPKIGSKYDARNFPTRKPLKEIKDTIHNTWEKSGTNMRDGGDFFQALADIGLGFELSSLKAKAINKCRVCHGVLDNENTPDLCNNCYNTGIIGLGKSDDGKGQQYDARTPVWDWDTWDA